MSFNVLLLPALRVAQLKHTHTQSILLSEVAQVPSSVISAGTSSFRRRWWFWLLRRFVLAPSPRRCLPLLLLPLFQRLFLNHLLLAVNRESKKKRQQGKYQPQKIS